MTRLDDLVEEVRSRAEEEDALNNFEIVQRDDEATGEEDAVTFRWQTEEAGAEFCLVADCVEEMPVDHNARMVVDRSAEAIKRRLLENDVDHECLTEEDRRKFEMREAASG